MNGLCGAMFLWWVGNAGSQLTPGIFFILGVVPYICSGGVKLAHFNLSLRKGFGQDTSGPFILGPHSRVRVISPNPSPKLSV